MKNVKILPFSDFSDKKKQYGKVDLQSVEKLNYSVKNLLYFNFQQ